MPIFCSDVNRIGEGKLVPITRHNGASIGPDVTVMTLEQVEMGPENGPFWELEAEKSIGGERGRSVSKNSCR